MKNATAVLNGVQHYHSPLFAGTSRVVGRRQEKRVTRRQSTSGEWRRGRRGAVVDAEERRRPALGRLQPRRLAVTAGVRRRRRRQRDRGTVPAVRRHGVGRRYLAGDDGVGSTVRRTAERRHHRAEQALIALSILTILHNTSAEINDPICRLGYTKSVSTLKTKKLSLGKKQSCLNKDTNRGIYSATENRKNTRQWYLQSL